MKPAMTFSLNKRTIIALAIILLLLLLPLVRFGVFLTAPAGRGDNVQVFDFEQGWTLKRIAGELETKKIVSSARLFILCARLRGDTTKVQAGTYQFNDGMTPNDILGKMVSGDVYVKRFAVPEGYSIFQIGELLEGRGLFKKEAFLTECFSPTLLKEMGIAGKSVEGYLYPSTYNIPPTMGAADLIQMMVNRFDTVYGEKFAGRAKAAGISTRQVVTLASMIEKEAVEPSERPLISSVFHNRLKKGMRLQSDPTAVYGVRAFAGTVTKQDITRPSPYNTYLIGGLPPGPIGNPGSAAIEAALHPAETSYLYFVAKKDGFHFFSTSLDEHNRAVQTYLKSSATSHTMTSGATLEYHNDHPTLTGRR